MKKTLKVLAGGLIGLVVVLSLGYQVLDARQSRHEIATIDTGLLATGKLQAMNEEEATLQDAYFKEELPKSKVPFFSVNVVDVSSKNYEQAVDNIEIQQAVMAVLMHERYEETFHFSVQDYGATKRILSRIHRITAQPA